MEHYTRFNVDAVLAAALEQPRHGVALRMLGSGTHAQALLTLLEQTGKDQIILALC